MSVTDTNRRNFLKLSAGLGAGLGLAVSLPASTKTESAATAEKQDSYEFNAFLHITPDNQVIVIIKHLEMGQGVSTGLATLVAEELNADWSQVRIEAAPADARRYNNLFWGPAQGTGGSTAIANSFEQLRKAGATGKAMLVAAAATRWGVNTADLSVNRGVVSHRGSGRRADFGELAEAAALQPVPAPETLALKSPKDFELIGQNLSRKDRGKTDGSAIYTQDIKLPGMQVAVVAHPPRFGGRVTRVNDQPALALPGVEQVISLGNAVAVVAQDYWSAKKARDRLEITWDESEAFKLGSADVMARFKAAADQPGVVARSEGDSDKAIKRAARTLEASFEFPFLAHATMEPMNCVALVSKDGCEIWNGAQLHTGDQYAVAGELGIKPEQVKVNTLFAGGSFGRRANPHSDYILQAVRIAKAMPGTPVKLVWSREDDTRAGYYRPAYLHKIRAALDEQGLPLTWQQTIVGQSIVAGTPFEGMIQQGVDPTMVEGASTLPYRIPNLHVDMHRVDLGLPVQWWRSVGHTHTGYSTEVFLDQLAQMAEIDPVEYRRRLLQDHPRHLGVLNLAAEKAAWDKPLPKGWGRGVAVHKSFNTYVAQVAEVSTGPNGQFKVERVVCAVDCGIAINPDVIRAQMEGGIGFGLSPVLMSEITLDQGRVVQSNFHDYRVARITDMPEVEVHIVASAEPPTGVGEPGTPPIAPAVANALANATGQRFHRLPIKVS
ncbi:xanthine dehydrogenase family protein molybdopterin-binding subunit [Pseudomaricurvus alkylphenolicus]|uniref:xanthine dehydrogenase family protein molybdopterin-binding subunit n=1 Tax=Pseudomaricurvus alkylphenolicus TaxID=1306991 RepID=UPI001422C2CA|nr:xanthine dehydrogenase family protein molybdopterin-binding subunit [Pseudomaricurvus alkylphenolicus]NIB37941.1 xanthine dehydrogenase family protein molybdopterin-binding subunit [Pseudomaricurvus alkylphenolicus]